MATACYCDVPVASLPLPPVSRPFPVAGPDAARDTLAADALLQSQLDALRTLQAQLAQLAQTWQPALSDAEALRPRLAGTCLLAFTLVAFRRDLDGLTRQCGALVHWTQCRLDRMRCGVQRLNAAHLALPSQERAHEPH